VAKLAASITADTVEDGQVTPHHRDPVTAGASGRHVDDQAHQGTPEVTGADGGQAGTGGLVTGTAPS
jgi:hypothetical protein